MEIEPHSNVLKESLVADAAALRRQMALADPGGDALSQVAATYQQALQRQQAKKGYPRLYRCAWKLLVECLATEDWDTLDRVHSVLRVTFEDAWQPEAGAVLATISAWHLQAVLYCWAYLDDAPRLGQGSETDAALLATRGQRPEEDARQLLKSVATLKCFTNMTPDEAHQRIAVEAQAPLDRARPFLLRLSTTLAGTVAATFQSPSGRLTQDVRLSVRQAMLLVDSRDLYADLLIDRLAHGHARYYSVEQVMALVTAVLGNELFEQDRATALLLAATQGGRVLAYDTVVPKARQAFWHGVVTRQVAPRTLKERLGLTQSYTAGYVDVSAVQTKCYVCTVGEVRLEEPLNEQVYCSQPCYDRDFAQCY